MPPYFKGLGGGARVFLILVPMTVHVGSTGHCFRVLFGGISMAVDIDGAGAGYRILNAGISVSVYVKLPIVRSLVLDHLGPMSSNIERSPIGAIGYVLGSSHAKPGAHLGVPLESDKLQLWRAYMQIGFLNHNRSLFLHIFLILQDFALQAFPVFPNKGHPPNDLGWQMAGTWLLGDLLGSH
jgi:hypothetical protein